MSPRPRTALSSLGAGLLGAALAAHAASTWRAHVLLAGASPVLGAILAAAALAGLLVGMRTRGLVPVAVVGAPLLVALGAIGAPVLFSRLSGPSSILAAAILVLLPALALSQLPPRRLGAGLIGGGFGALAAALLLPFASPLLTSLAAALVACVAALILGRATPPEPEPVPEGAPTPGLGALAALLGGAALGAASLVVVGGGSHPWPARPAQAALLTLGAGLGLAVGRRLPRGARVLVGIIGAALAALVALPATRAVFDRAAASLATSPSHPAVGVAGGLLTLLAGAAMVGLPAGFGAGLSGGAAPTRLRAALAAVVGLLVAACILGPRSRTRLVEVTGEAPSTSRLGLLDGHSVAWNAAQRLPEDVFAAHLGALAATGHSRAVVLGWGSPATLQSLRLHGFASVEEAGPGAPSSPGLDAAGRVPPSRRIRGVGDLRHLGPCDLVVSNLDDPTLDAHEAFFTREAHEAIRRALLPGGAYVQRLSIERLGPEGLLRQVSLLRETFPETWIATSDLGHGGSVLALCLGAPAHLGGRTPLPRPDQAEPASAPEQPPESRTDVAPSQEPPRARTGTVVEPAKEPVPPPEERRLLPLAQFLSHERLPPEVQEDLRQARLLTSEDVLTCFAAGPNEIEALEQGLAPFDPWTPGSLAFRHPAPADVARDLAQALLYGRLAAVDVLFAPEFRTIPGSHPQAWDLIGMDSALGTEWVPTELVMRIANRLGNAFGHPGVSRASARRLVLEAPGRHLEIRQRRMGPASRDVVAGALADLEGPSLIKSGGAVVHGHPALWMLEQDGTQRQEVTLAWYCPVQASLYTAELVITSGVKPGLHEEPLRILTDELRCRHVATRPTEAGEATPEAQDAIESEPDEAAAATGPRP